MTAQRPTPVGKYEILQDYETKTASVRVIRMEGSVEQIEQHIHHKSMQIYLVIAGEARITADGVEHIMRPFETLSVYAGTAHGAAPVGPQAILANISIPPLQADDQLPVTEEYEPPDLKLPRIGSDYDD